MVENDQKMKNNDLDFDRAWADLKATECYNGSSSQAITLMDESRHTIQFALALAKEIQAGTVTDEMLRKGFAKINCRPMNCEDRKTNIEMIYKAMTQELMKKVKEDLR